MNVRMTTQRLFFFILNLFFYAVVLQGKIKRNPFCTIKNSLPDEVIASASVCDATDVQISFVHVQGKIRCIKRKTPSTWES